MPLSQQADRKISCSSRTPDAPGQGSSQCRPLFSGSHSNPTWASESLIVLLIFTCFKHWKNILSSFFFSFSTRVGLNYFSYYQTWKLLIFGEAFSKRVFKAHLLTHTREHTHATSRAIAPRALASELFLKGLGSLVSGVATVALIH